MADFLSKEKEIQQFPQTTALLSTVELCSHFEVSEDLSKAVLLSEILVREWMVGKAFDNNVIQIISAKRLDEFYHKVAKQLGNLNLNAAPSEIKQLDFSSEVLSESKIFEEHIATRLKNILSRDGWIVVIHKKDLSTKEGIVIPFAIEEKPYGQSSCIDIFGNEIHNWSNILDKEEGILKGKCCRLLLHAGLHANRLEQGSLCLPVFLARKFQDSGRNISNSLLATGSVTNGKVEDSTSVLEDTKLKFELSKKLHDGIFISPGEISMDDQLHLPIAFGSGFGEIFAKVEEKLKELGLIGWSLSSARAYIEKVEPKVKDRKEDLNSAIGTIHSVLEFLNNHEGDASLRNQLIGDSHKILGAAFDHKLNPREASKHFDIAEKYIRGTLKKVSLRSHRIVSLTDQGELNSARVAGDELISFVAGCTDDVEHHEQLNIEVRSCGATAAQYMFYFGLLGCEKSIKDSLSQLEKAMQKANELHEFNPKKHLRDVCQDWCQLVNWYALFEPENCEGKYRQAVQKFKNLDLSHKNQSWHFLTRIRFLGAWRALELKGIKPEEIETWPIRESSPDNRWLTALIYKYRSAIRRELGQEKEAMKDITWASNYLTFSNASFQNMLRATIFVEKCRLTELEADKSDALKCLEFLEKLGYLKDHPQIAPSAWKELLDVSLKGEDPRLLFPY